ncbi:cell wall metabolism sensor histidine kinase WalK [Enterococcus sp. S86.2]|uniref:sensor histidine kinase n=1 Tax=Enterococcus sp. S86.2 TaxID=3031299 RepID=UPI0026F0D2A0|nr:HAMP domain-containing sensor histidine kinase [Enterococcus sp. S86.2]
MNKELSKKQRRQFFLLNAGAFALIFLLLGFIVLQLLQSSAYKQTDESLKNISQDERSVTMEITRLKEGNPFLMPKSDFAPMENRSNRFNSQMILWSAEGKILNQAALGGRFTELQDLTLTQNKLDSIERITVKNGQQQLHFRSITRKLATPKENVAYVQLLENTDQIDESLQTFKTVLIMCMILFWLLSLAVSYFISKKNMAPILLAWQKQQEFVENASHELRTPLTIIQNSLQKLFTTPNHTILEESKAIAQALNETRRLNSLTTDLLTIARSDANETTLTLKQLAPQPFLAQLIKPFQEIAQLDGKIFVLENYAATPVTVDEKRIHQLLVILLDNALKYTKTGDKITVLSQITHDDWLLEVRNTGATIHDEDKKQIFERFYREERSRNKNSGGFGLGLSIAWQIVKDHHGKISVHDLKPKGVIFRVKIPAKQ